MPEQGIVIGNHQGWFDWLYSWILMYHAGRDTSLQFLVYSTAKSFPVVGQNWAKDSKKYFDQLLYLLKKNSPTWLMIFPEGYLVCEETRQVSNKFAEKNGLKPTKYTLLPRVTGLLHAVNTLRSKMSYIYDYTFGFEGIQPGEDNYTKFSVESQLFYQNGPRHVHVHVRRFKISEIPSDEPGFTAWMYDIWYQKEELMNHFYTNGVFPAAVIAERVAESEDKVDSAQNSEDEDIKEDNVAETTYRINPSLRTIEVELPHPFMVLQIISPLFLGYISLRYFVPALFSIVSNLLSVISNMLSILSWVFYKVVC
ncbi:hypothetical protein BB558_002205 [Smittium angustum]|uniref:Phospholipid/glycerol acyltransferase domain-containing protein n=1 Tax=Smittium angustum TaxID=133377 RepID=A0A2U1J9B4_SMIAN|nr:hypothetical protein BB558_006180 [Smittium angustum]PWA01677.1 hypothetical protein BB558_002205 [Smittium angustum]